MPNAAAQKQTEHWTGIKYTHKKVYQTKSKTITCNC